MMKSLSAHPILTRKKTFVGVNKQTFKTITLFKFLTETKLFDQLPHKLFCSFSFEKKLKRCKQTTIF